MGKSLSNKYFIASLAAFAAFVLYLPSLHNSFVEWDDLVYVIENPHIRSIDSAFFRWAFFDFYSSNWHPLTWLSHALDYALWGLDPFGHNLTNNILHSVNTFIVVLLAVRLVEQGLSSRVVEWSSSNDSTTQQLNSSRFTIYDSRFTLIAAGVTGLLFGLHPLHVESVAWVAERKDLLCAFFFLLSIMSYTTYASNRTVRNYLLCLGFFVLALLSKPMAVSLPVVLLILDWYPLQRIRSLRSLRAAFTEKLPFIALSIASSILTVLAQKATGSVVPIAWAPLPTRVLVAVKALTAYLGKMILPLNLSPYYSYPKNVSLSSLEYLLPLLLVTGITVYCLLAARKKSLWLSVWAYYVITLTPVLGIVQVGGQALADRYTYLPCIGPFLIAGLAASRMFCVVAAPSKSGFVTKLVSVFFAVIVLATLWLTYRQVSIWKDGMTLWNYVIEKEPGGAAVAYLNRGVVFEKRGQFDRAIEDYSSALGINWTFTAAYVNRAIAFEKSGQLARALQDYNMAIAFNPSDRALYVNRGRVFEKMGLIDRALFDYRLANSGQSPPTGK